MSRCCDLRWPSLRGVGESLEAVAVTTGTLRSRPPEGEEGSPGLPSDPDPRSTRSGPGCRAVLPLLGPTGHLSGAGQDAGIIRPAGPLEPSRVAACCAGLGSGGRQVGRDKAREVGWAGELVGRLWSPASR